MSENEEWKPVLVDGIRTEAVGNELILLDKGSQRVHQLDKVGVKILSFCDGTRSVEKIVDELLNEFDANEVQLTQDVNQLLDRMRTLKLLG